MISLSVLAYFAVGVAPIHLAAISGLLHCRVAPILLQLVDGYAAVHSGYFICRVAPASLCISGLVYCGVAPSNSGFLAFHL